MKSFLPIQLFYFIFLLTSIANSGKLLAQQTALDSFVVLAGNGGTGTTAPGALGYGVIIQPNTVVTTITGGKVGALTMIKTLGATTFNANIQSNGQVVLGNSNIVTGKISAANTSNLPGTIFSSGTNSQLSGNIDVKGNIVIGGGTVNAIVKRPSGTTYTGPNPAQNLIGIPNLPVFPAFPAILSFPAAGATTISTTQTIAPGSYGNLNLANNQTITFNGPGTYVFNAINFTDAGSFIFNFQNSPTGVFRIYVHGDMNLKRINTSMIQGGSAARIFYETHGNGTSSPTGKDAVTILNSGLATANKFYGTIWAPYAAISTGSGSGKVDMIGALYSKTQIYIRNGTTITSAPVSQCALVLANAGIDTVLYCPSPNILLTGTANIPNAQFAWTTSNGILGPDSNLATTTVSQAGSYRLKVTDPITGCFARDTVVVTYSPCTILPGYVPPPGGKKLAIIGPDLSSLADNFSSGNPNEDVFIMQGDSVWVEIIYKEGKYAALNNLLTLPPFSLTEFIDNGTGNRIVSTLMRVSELDDLNNLNITANDSIINFARPLYRPIVSTGVAYTLGDIAQKSDLARGGFNVSGEGIKIGVLSNSYNTQPGNPAQIDILNGDLPGVGNPNGKILPVQVNDYQKSKQSDEGRAMLQLIHDIAPKAELAFRTGFLSAGDMAKGIKELQQAGCHIEVDDITYISEPYFTDGMIATAVNEAKAQGVSYFTAAGNFGDRSYESFFNPTAAPNNLAGMAHDFGGGDKFQSISLTPGSYLAVLQWEDGFYSIDDNQVGTQNDLDFYLTNNNGNTLFGFNRRNIGGDPIEVLPFTVTANTTTNILITRAAGTGNVHFKYIFFKGSPVINEFNIGNSTIVGQANAAGAITLGAVSYLNTPAFGVNSPTKASFSSVGGTIMGGSPRQKPDLCAPNGGNTTVYLGGPDIDGDLFPNFFGTSAAAPHAAGVAALILSARIAYYGGLLTPDQVKTTLTTNAKDMYSPGFDYLSGYGLLDAYSCLKSFAEPKPKITSLEVPLGLVPGAAPFMLTIVGEYLTPNALLLFRDDTLVTTFIDEQHLTASIPIFSGNPALHVCIPPVSNLGGDGGCSDSLYFFAPIKKQVVVKADNKVKKYGEGLPSFTSSITVDGVPLANSGYTEADLGLLSTINYVTPANELSNVANYRIDPTFTITDSSLNELFEYFTDFGILTVQKLPLVIKPRDTTYTFGDKINGQQFNFNYIYDDENISTLSRAAILDTLELTYKDNIIKELALIDDRDTYTITVSDGNGGSMITSVSLSPTELQNLSILSGGRAIANGGRAIANGGRAIANNSTPDTTHVIDLFYGSLVNYNENGINVDFDSNYMLINGGRAIANGGRGIVNLEALANGDVIVNGGRAIANGGRAIANGGRAIANGDIIDSVSNTNVAVIVHNADLDAVEDPNENFELFSLCGITGLSVGDHYIIPGNFANANFSITYELGNLHIDPFELDIIAHDTTTTYGTSPTYNYHIEGFQYDDSLNSVFAGPPAMSVNVSGDLQATEGPGSYEIIINGLSFQTGSANYSLNYVNGDLEVLKADLDVSVANFSRPYGVENGNLLINYMGFQYYDDESDLIILPEASTTATLMSPPGSYSISICCGTALNYNLIYHPSTLTVELPPTCSIDIPTQLPYCGSLENTLTATAPSGYDYEWSFAGVGFNYQNQYENQLYYSVDNLGIEGKFTFKVFTPVSHILVSTCIWWVNNRCDQFCTYTQADWGNSAQDDCSGNNLSAALSTLLNQTLLSGDDSRTISFDLVDAACLVSRLPSGNELSLLPLGNTDCSSTNTVDYVNSSNQKFRNQLLGNSIALALSIRKNPGLANLRITDRYLATSAATSCENGEPVSYSWYYELSQTVVSELGYNNKVSDLLLMANRKLGGTLVGGPTFAQIDTTIRGILDGLHNCRIIDNFYDGVPSRIKNPNLSTTPEDTPQLSIYPNPMSARTSISFSTKKDQPYRIELYSVSGALLRIIANDIALESGTRTIEMDCSDYAGGLYYIRLTNGDDVSVKKLVIMGH